MFRQVWIFCYCIFLTLPIWSQEEVLIPVPLYIEGEYSGEIDLKINGQVLVQPRPLFERLSPLLDQEKLEITMNRWRQVEWTPFETLEKSLIRAEYDETLLIVLVEIPPESRKPGSYSLVRETTETPENLTEPALFSGVLNLEGWSRLDYTSSLFDYETGPEIGLNFAGYLLEAKGGIQSQGELYYADYLRLVKDFLPLSLRGEAGDLTYDANGLFQDNLVGLSLFRKTSVDMNYMTVPELGHTIYFPESTEVEFRVNGKTVRRRRIPAGTWTFRNFPLTQGPNDIEILWTDSTGDHRETFFQIYDISLLKQHEMDWGVSGGTDSWETFNPVILGHFAMGVTNTFTAGIGSCFNLHQGRYVFETPLGFATALGTFQLVPSLDIRADSGTGGGVMLNHSFSDRRTGHFSQSFGSSWGYQRETYPAEAQIFSSRVYYTYSPMNDLSFIPSVYWKYETVQEDHTYNFSVRIRKSVVDGSTISAQIGMEYLEGEWSPKAVFTYSISFPRHQQNFYAMGDISGESMTLSWNRYSATDKQEDYSLAASAVIPSNRENRLSLSMSGGYVHPRFTAGISQGFNTFLASDNTDNSTTLSAGTALVYADGVLGWSRPIRSEFVIIESGIGPLAVNPTSGGAMLEMDGESPGVISSLSPYRYTTLTLLPEDLPLGADINDYRTVVFPSFRSGTLIRIEEKVSMYAGGILLDKKGSPLDLVLGEIMPLSDSAVQKDNDWPQEFFTDENGYFECYGLVPGKYLLTQKDRGFSYIIEVSADDSGFYDLGEVSPEVRN